EDIRMICAWCEMREDFRHFRTDRVTQMSLSDDRFPERVQTLQRRWKAQREAERARNREGGV
ncbi:MAG: YafY family transcriptional regulator, partial [Hyphomonas sp.]|nr:YafY family transcriptional regulator [Hyphomonas sp.]